jgi:hypothetical protein
MLVSVGDPAGRALAGCTLAEAILFRFLTNEMLDTPDDYSPGWHYLSLRGGAKGSWASSCGFTVSQVPASTGLAESAQTRIT